MKRRDSRISEADWKTLITYWRSSVFESRSAIAKKNHANAVPHTSGSKSHARVANEMAIKLGHDPRRDQVYIKTHTCKKGDRKDSYVPQAAARIKDLIGKAETHPEWKEKSIKEGDLFARVCGIKEPRGRVRVLGLGPMPQDLGTPGTRGKISTRGLVAMEGRRVAKNRVTMLEEHVKEMHERMKRMELISHNRSNSRQNSRVEAEEDNDGEEDDQGEDEEPFVHRRVVAKPPARSSSAHEDESLIGMDVLLYAWTGPETPVAKATIISVDPDTIVGEEPLGPGTYEMLSQSPLHGHLARQSLTSQGHLPRPAAKERQEDKEGAMKLVVSVCMVDLAIVL